MNNKETLRDAVIGVFGEELCSPCGYRREVVRMTDGELCDFISCIFDSTQYITDEQKTRLEKALC